MRRFLIPALSTNICINKIYIYIDNRQYQSEIRNSSYIIKFSSKSLQKATSQICAPRKLFPKNIIKNYSVHHCSPLLLQKPIYKAAPQRYSRNLLSKVGPRSCPRAVLHSPKIGSQIFFPKIIQKVIPQNFYWRLFLNICGKNIVLQSKYSSNFYRKIVQSCSPKLFPDVTSQN